MYQSNEHIILLEILDSISKQTGKHTDSIPREFIMRLTANFSVLRKHFMTLYGDQKKCEKYFKRLLYVLFQSYQKRPKDLCALDHRREANHQWLLDQKWVGMSLYVDLFAGNLRKLQEKIAYLEQLGVNLVHLMPILKTPKGASDGGYAVSDYRQIEPELGDMSDLKKISKKFRKRGILLVIDLVLNHTSDSHEWALKAKTGKKKYQQYYYMFDDRAQPDKYESHMPEVFPSSAPGNFTYQRDIDKWVMTVFHNYQWDLNYRNPEVLIEMIDNLLFLANQGADILRLDAPAFLWKEFGTSGQNLPQAHSILKLMKRCSEIVAPGIKFIAEAIVSPAEIMKYYGGNDEQIECDIAYHATLMALSWDALATTKTALIYKSLSKLTTKPLGTTWITYIRGHDDIGLGFDDEDIMQVGFDPKMHRAFLLDYYTGKFKGSPAKGALFMHNQINNDARISGSLASLAGLEQALQSGDDKKIDQSIKKILLLHALIMSFGGLPMIFSGDEIGLTNDYSYKDQQAKKYDNRWMHRPQMDWEAAEGGNSSRTVRHRIFQGLQEIISIRKQSPEFADYNSTELVYCENEHVLAFLRYSKCNSLKTLVLINFHSSLQLLKKAILLHQGFDLSAEFYDKITGKAPTYLKGYIKMQPYQVYFISDNKQ
jgi:amylosucrase